MIGDVLERKLVNCDHLPVETIAGGLDYFRLADHPTRTQRESIKGRSIRKNVSHHYQPIWRIRSRMIAL